jgi:hypothetical protein
MFWEKSHKTLIINQNVQRLIIISIFTELPTTIYELTNIFFFPAPLNCN